MSAPKLPPHGTSARYRRELKEGKACPKCRSAESQRRRDRRTAKAPDALRPVVSIFGGGQSDGQDAGSTDTLSPDVPQPPEPGEMELAVRQDIFEAASTVPFHHSLEAMAIALSREIDAPDSKASKSASTKQLYDVLKSLRGEGGTDGDPTGIQALLQELNVPLVPGRAPALRNSAKSKKPDPGNP